MPANGGESASALSRTWTASYRRQLEDIEYGAPVFITDETVGANGDGNELRHVQSQGANVDRKSASAVLRGEVLDSARRKRRSQRGGTGNILKTANVRRANKHDYDEEIDIGCLVV